MRSSNLARLAAALSLHKSTLCRWRRQAWFPQPATDGTWDLDEIRATAAAAGKLGAAPAAVAPGAATPPRAPLAGADLLSTLDDAKASDVELLDAALRLAARQIAEAGRRGLLGGRDVSDLTRASEELRRAKDAALDLALRQGTVIQRDLAVAALGVLAGRLLTILTAVENALPAQVQYWRENLRLHPLPTKEQDRLVQEWFADQSRALRQAEADLAKEALREAEEDAKR